MGGTGYGGIEKLAGYAARELAGRGHQVDVACPEGSLLPRGVGHISTGRCGDFVLSELAAFQHYRHLLPNYEAILDYSHSHWAMREIPNLPALCFIWHDPVMMQAPVPPYGVYTLSEWQRQRFRQVYHQKAQVLDPHCGPSGEPGLIGESYLFVGKMGPQKGCLEALELCKELNMPLDIVGVPGPGDPPEYLMKVKLACGGGIIYWGGVNDKARQQLTARARALIYPVSYPQGQGEAHSHKIVDSLLWGCPVVIYDTGAMREVVEDGVTGFLAHDREEFKRLMLEVIRLDRGVIQERAMARWSFKATGDRLEKALLAVAKGER